MRMARPSTSARAKSNLVGNPTDPNLQPLPRGLMPPPSGSTKQVDKETPNERFEDLAETMFSTRAEDLEQAREREEDAEEVMEGGVPPSEGEADE